MAVEIVFSNEMSRGMDPETAVLTSDLTRAFKRTSSERERHSRAEANFLFYIKYYDGWLFFSQCIDLHGFIIHHKTSNVH